MVRQQPTFYELDNKMVAVFSIVQDDCEIKMECLFSKHGIEDYTVEFFGPNERKVEFIELAVAKAKKLIENKITAV